MLCPFYGCQEGLRSKSRSHGLQPGQDLAPGVGIRPQSCALSQYVGPSPPQVKTERWWLRDLARFQLWSHLQKEIKVKSCHWPGGILTQHK